MEFKEVRPPSHGYEELLLWRVTLLPPPTRSLEPRNYASRCCKYLNLLLYEVNFRLWHILFLVLLAQIQAYFTHYKSCHPRQYEL